MAPIHDVLSRAAFRPLPRPEDHDGTPRLAGVEIEFSGLTEAKATREIRRALGGHAVRSGHNAFAIEDSALGRLDIYLDTAFRKPDPGAIRALGLDLSRDVVPVEVVTRPLDLDGLRTFGEVVDRLRAAGAEGSRAGILLGYGVHYNVAIEAPGTRALLPVMRAYAVLEDWLRVAGAMDGTRRLLPFTDPWPRAFVRRLLTLPADCSIATLIDLYLADTPTRNRGLDMLPVFRWIDEARVVAAISGASSVNARPTFHYRLPDSRIDEPGWSLAYEWNRWVLIERVAGDDALLATLGAAWQDHHRMPRIGRQGWSDRVEAVLQTRRDLWEDLT